MAGDRLVKVVQSNQHESTNQLRGRDMAGDLITIVASRRLTQLTINNQTQGSLARTEDLRSVKRRALPDVPLSQSSLNHASAEQVIRASRVKRFSAYK